MTYHIPLLIAAIILGWAAWIVIYSEQTQTERKRLEEEDEEDELL